MIDGVHVLYRFYSATGQLLYVGKTTDPPKRFRQHSRDKDWWDEVASITMAEKYDTEAELLAAERRAIQIERPKHNSVHNGRFKLVGSGQLDDASAIFQCDTCNAAIASGDGYLHVRESDIVDAEGDEDCRRRHIRADSLLVQEIRLLAPSELPRPARWRASHADCDETPYNNLYLIEVERADTAAKLLAWSAQLAEKSWLHNTNWATFVRGLIENAASNDRSNHD